MSANLLGLDEFGPLSPLPPQPPAQSASTTPTPSTKSKFTPKTLVADADSDDKSKVINHSAQLKSNSGFFKNLNKGLKDSNDVTFPPGNIGITLEPSADGRQCVVKAFPKRRDEKSTTNAMLEGPAARSGLVCIGDVIVALDGESVMDLTFKQTMAKLRASQDKHHIISFRSIDSISDLSQFNTGHAKDISETRKLIHSEKEKWYLSPENSDMCYCYVERVKGQHTTSFNLYREDTGEFMIAAACASNMTGGLVFTNFKDCHLRKIEHIVPNPDSSTYLGCMSCNFLGNTFTIYNHRADPKKVVEKGYARGSSFNELAVVKYDQNLTGRIPNFMSCIIPRPEAESERGDMRRVQKESIAARYDKKYGERRKSSVGENIVNFLSSPFKSKKEKQAVKTAAEAGQDDSEGGEKRGGWGGLEQEDHQDLLIMNTKKPSWNKRLSAWTLNFSGRVKRASKKNFLLVAKSDNFSFEGGGAQAEVEGEDEGGSSVYLRFGKFTKNKFILDFQAPMSTTVALGICVTAFTKKLTVT